MFKVSRRNSGAEGRSRSRAGASGARWIALFATLLLIGSAVPVLAEEPQASLPATPSEGELRSPDGADVREAMEELDREEAARKRWLESPEAVRAREESREAFIGLGATQAQQLLSDLFGKQLAELNADPARFISDAETVRVVDDEVATVKDGGEKSLLDAGIPLRAEDEDGNLGPLDLSLVGTDDGYAPANGLSETKLPAVADDPIRIGGEGFSVSQAGAGDRPAQLFGDKNLFYGEILTDTDLFVAPTATGVEIFNLLRSQNSPETLRFQQDLPAGAELRSDGNGGAEIARGDDVLVHVPFPTAVDAQGTLVPVELQVEGSSLVLQVPHRSKDLAYPILVDPDYSEDNWYNCSWYNGCNFQGLHPSIWRFVKSPENGNWIYGSTSCIDQWACWPPGGRSLFVTSTNGNFGANYYGEYIYDAPGTTGYISGYLISPFWRQNHTNCTQQSHPYPRDYNGLYGSNWTVFEANRADDYGDAMRYDLTDASARKLVIGLGAGPGASIPCWRSIMAGGVHTWLKDPEQPTAYKVVDPPTNWVSKTTPITVKTQVYDPGLGIRNVLIGTDGEGVIPHTPVQNDCPGNRQNPCPNELLATFNLTGASFGEGRRAEAVTAYDATGKSSNPYYFETKVDGTEPEVKLDGQLAKATKDDQGEQKGDEEVEKLSLPIYNLKIEAKDGTAGSNEKLWRSGVKTIVVVLDGKPSWEKVWQQNCPAGNCPMTQTYQLELSKLTTSGKHTLEVAVIDQAGNSRPRKIEFEYFPATGIKDEYVMHYFPLPDGQGDESAEEHPDRPELVVNVMNGNLVYREQDVEVDGPGVDLEVERYYNSQLPEGDNTEWGDGWTLAQTPDLEPVDTEGGPAPDEAELLDSSGAIKEDVVLPTEAGAQEFDPGLQATLTKKASGGYELSDETGESATSVAFSESGRTEALVSDGYAKVDYAYEGGELAEIAVEDPATFSVDPASIEEPDNGPISTPAYASSFGTEGSADGQLKSPGDVAFDSAGNLWVVDKSNNRVQKFDATGKCVAKLGSYGTANGEFDRPTAIAISPSGNLFVTDSGNNRVQAFGPSGNFLAKVGSKGTGNGQFSSPEGVAIDAAGNVWVADTENDRLQKFGGGGTFIKAVGSAGTGSGQLEEPSAIDIDPDGNLWVAERGNDRLSVFDGSGAFLSHVGSAGSGEGEFSRPGTVDVDAQGNVWVGDQDNDRIQRFDLVGKYLDQFGSSGSGKGQFGFSYPMGIAADAKGHLWVTDVDNHRVQEWLAPIPEPTYARSFGTEGSGDGQLKHPGDVAVDALGNLWVVDKSNNRVQKFDATGKYVAKFGSYGTANGQFDRPTAIAISPSGNLFVTDSGNNRVQAFGPNGNFLAKVGSKGTGNGQFGGSGPEGIAIDAAGNVWVADTYNHRVQKFSPNGTFLQSIGSQGTGSGQLEEPSGIDVDLDGNLWVAEWGNNRLSVFDSDGTFLSHVGSAGEGDGELNHPDTVTVDAHANVWVGDQDNNRVQRFDIAGQYLGQFGSQGSGAGQFELSYPMGIAADAKGHLWVTDVDNHRVQEWLFGNFAPPVEPQPIDDDPVVAVETASDLVSSLEGEEAGEHIYEHDGELLTAHEGPEGGSAYEYDSADRMTKVTLPNGTWGQIAYYASDGRVQSVTVDPAGSAPSKTTYFEYSDEPRRTFVEVPGAPNITYDIGDDGSVLKWWNAKSPPTIQPLGGTLYDKKETPEPISVGDYSLIVHGYSEEGVESIQIIANGNQLVDEKTCPQIPGNGVTECVDVESAWVLETYSHSPGILNLEVIVTDTDEGVASERFWVNIPRTPPPLPGADVPPRFKDIKKFREDHGLEVVFPVASETELNERIFNLIAAWHNPNSPTGQVARASWERWGVPLRPADVAEMEWRLQYWNQASAAIPTWAFTNANSTFAGFYIDERAGGIVRVGFTGQQATQTLTALKEGAGLMAPERVSGFTTPPQHTLSALEGLASQVETAEGYPAGLITNVAVDIPSNTIQVGASNVSQAKNLLQSDFGSQIPITVTYRLKRRELKVGRERIGGMVRAGDEIIHRYPETSVVGPCTASFGAFERAKNPNTGGSVLRLFALSAGHCAEVGETVRRRSNPQPTDDEKQVIGKVGRSGYEDLEDLEIDVDANAIRLDSSSFVPRQIFQAEGMPLIDVTSVWSPTVGTNLCFSGRTSKNIIRCGPVLSPPRVEFYGNGDKELTVCFEEYIWGGDSGSPVWVEGTGVAVGIAVMGYGGPEEPGLTPQELEEEQSAPKEACATLLMPYPGGPPEASVFGSPDLAPLHLVTRSNATS